MEDVSCEDCPVSLISRQSLDWLNLRNRVQVLSTEYGIQMFQPGKIHARDADALVLLEMEDRKHGHANNEALDLERPGSE